MDCAYSRGTELQCYRTTSSQFEKEGKKEIGFSGVTLEDGARREGEERRKGC